MSATRDAASSDPASATVVGGGLDLTIASIQARQKKLEAAFPNPDDATAEILREYGEAVDQLQLASEWRERAEALARVQRDGQRMLDAARRDADDWAKQPVAPLAADATRADVEALLAETEAKLSVTRKALLDVDADQAKLSDRRLSLPADLASASAEREGLLSDVDLPPLPSGSVETTLATRALAMAKRKATAEQVSALELELATFETRRELLVARRDLLKRKADAWTARVAELQSVLAAKRAKEAEATAAEARADQAALARVHPILGSLAEENARLAAERTGPDGLSARIDEASRELTGVSAQLQDIEERSKGVRQKVAAAGLTDAIGLLLRKERGELPSIDRARADIRAHRDEIAAVQLESLNLEDMQKALPGVESEVEGILAAQGDAIAAADRARIEASARNVLKTRRSYLDALIRDYNSYFGTLVDLDAKEAELVRVLDDYRGFLDQHVLWIPNAGLPSIVEASNWKDAALWLVDARNYRATAARILSSAGASPIATAWGLLLLAASVVYRRRLKRLHAAICARQREPATGLLPGPAEALLVGALLAVPGPLLAWLVAWMIRAAPTPPDDFSNAVASTLSSLAFPLLVAELVRRGAGPQGPAAAFLAWPRAALAQIRAQTIVVETIAFPAFVVAALLDAQPRDDWSETLGRAAFCFAVGTAGASMHRLLSPHGVLVEQVLKRADLEWMRPMLARTAWIPALITSLVIGIALLGYYYTAFVLVERLWLSTIVLLAFVVANAGVLHWLARKELAASEAAVEFGDSEEGDEAAALATADALSHVSAQTRSLLRVVFGIALVGLLFSVWVDVFPALRFFENIELWQVSAVVDRTIGTGDAAHVEQVPVQVPVTMANLLVAVLGAGLAVVGARNIPGLLELVVLSRMRLDRGLRYAIATVTRYVVFVAGTVVALGNLGVGWSSVQWLVAAVSVGLGFGLQEIFGNFVSGLILLFERPVRVGDMVTIDGVNGVVSRIEMRATTILDPDRKELIVPNKSLITGKLVNWSLCDSTVRVVIPVGVAYGSDTSVVLRVLQDVAKQCATVLENPPWMVLFTGFGASSLDFELRAFVGSTEQLVTTRHELMMEIERKLRAAGIEIPFPQQDLHLRSIDPAAVAALAASAPPPEPPR